jgi:prepilin-type N-terminal cleavage/methylation domain-containing protein
MKLMQADTQRADAGRNHGFTLIELVIVIVVVAIGIALAVPTYSSIVEKRRMTAAAEQIASFLTFAQGEAIKRNEEVTVSWISPGSHNVNWCIGAALGDDVCVCTQTDPGEGDFCAIDDIPYRLVQPDFTDVNHEFMHMNPNSGSYSYDPIRGTLVNISDNEIVDNDYLFYVHSDEGSGSTREFELQIWLNITGRVSICTSGSRKRIIGGYSTC